MGYNQTFEIIIKDIQDIEKLVANFKNSSEVPKIELDLALSKLRNVYDLMLIFRDDEKEGTGNYEFINDVPVARKEPSPGTVLPEEKPDREAGRPVAPENKKDIEDDASSVDEKQETEKLPEEKLHTEISTSEQEVQPTDNSEEDVRFIQSGIDEKTEEDTPEMKEPEKTESLIPKGEVTKADKEIQENEPEGIPAEKKQDEQKKKDKILAEQYEKRKEYINEKLGERNVKADVSSRLRSAPIQKIAGSMGINDKFFFIRELFGGDAEKFRSSMDVLDHAPDFDTAYNYLENEFHWDMDSSTVRQLLNLVRRKFISER